MWETAENYVVEVYTQKIRHGGELCINEEIQQ